MKGFLCFVLLGFSTLLLAQGNPSATFNSSTEIVLSNVTPVPEYYDADITLLGFTNREEAETFFNSKTDNLVEYTVNFASQKATIHLILGNEVGSSWGVSDWNNYLNNKLSE